MPSELAIRLAALFHDVGKPLAYIEDEEHIGHFYGHWTISKEIFLDFARRHNLDPELTNTVANLIYYHDLNPADIGTDIANRLGLKDLQLLFILKRADALAQNKKYNHRLALYDEEEQRIRRLVK